MQQGKLAETNKKLQEARQWLRYSKTKYIVPDLSHSLSLMTIKQAMRDKDTRWRQAAGLTAQEVAALQTL